MSNHGTAVLKEQNAHLSESVRQQKKLLGEAHEEIAALRAKVGHCSVTIFETIISQERQEDEIKNLRARIAELETIVAQSEEQAAAAANIFEAMKGAMGRMQETVRALSERAESTVADADLKKQINELESAAASTLDDEALAEYNRQIESLRAKVSKN